jgi:2-dehydro-3-deoxygluconokinase
MSSLNIRKDACELDFLSLGALVNRLDPGVIPFRKARSLEIHVSGGEYNVAANLADCFGLKTGIATAMVNYPIGEMVQSACVGRISPRFTAIAVSAFARR